MKQWLLLILLFPFLGIAQNSNSVWIFGDSTGISFLNLTNPMPLNSNMVGRGSCAVFSDTSGSLLFYAFTRAGMGIDNTTVVYDNNGQLVQNGDSIAGEAWYNELTILPFVDSSNYYYLFSVAISNQTSEGLYYSVINVDSSSSIVIQKNIQLFNARATDCVQAIKHGNGQSWWVVGKQSGLGSTSYNRFFVYLVTDSGISSPFIQNLGGGVTDGDLQKFIFNHQGNKLMLINFSGFMCEYDFDRCTGIISNPNLIYPEQSSNYSRFFWEGTYSPNDSLFYATTTWRYYPQDTSRLLQFNLFAPNIPASCDTLFEQRNPNIFGAVKLAPNGKIYMASAFNWGFPTYPYPDSVYNQYNMNLSVINYPDSIGISCDFQPFSFYLGGKRTYWGLPNNPNYSLGKLVGSPCDTIQYAGLTPGPSPVGEGSLTATYVSSWQKLFVNAQNIKGKACVLKIFDVNGKEVFSSSNGIYSPSEAGGYFTQDVDVSHLSSGMYLVNLITDKESLSCKFVNE